MVEELSKCCGVYVSLHGNCSNCQKQHDFTRHNRFKIGDTVKVSGIDHILIGIWEGYYIYEGNYLGLDQVYFEFPDGGQTAFYSPDDLIKVGIGLIEWLKT